MVLYIYSSGCYALYLKSADPGHPVFGDVAKYDLDTQLEEAREMAIKCLSEEVYETIADEMNGLRTK